MRISYLINFMVGASFVLVTQCDDGAPQESFGPETTATAINQAQRDSLLKLDPFAVKKGQKVHFIETQEIITSGGPIKNATRESTIEVLSYQSQNNSDSITTLEKKINFQDEDPFVAEVKNVFYIGKNESILKNKVFALSNELSTKSLTEQSQVPESQILGPSYHNLKKTQITLIPPEKVQKSKGCAGLTNCKFQADLITFDVVFHLQDGNTQSHQLEWYISSDLPFFAGVLKQCATTLVPADDVRVLVKQCKEVVDFQFGDQ